MRWSAQVMHVARKDLRHSRWLLIAYITAAGAIAFLVSGWPRGASAGLWGLLIVPVLMTVAAAMVQADSPSRVDAFWVTRPLAPSAVAAAKLVALTIAAIVPAVVLQAFVLHAFDLSGATINRLLWISAEVQASLIITAMVIAALTRDLRSFLIVLIITFVAEQFLPALPWRPSHPLQVGSIVVFLAAVSQLIAFLVVLFYQYRSRNLRRGRTIGLAVWAVSTAVLPPMTRAAVVPRTQEARVAAATVDTRVDPRNFTVALDIPDEHAGERVVVADLHISGRAPGVHWDTSSFRIAALDQPMPDVGGKVRWLSPLSHWPTDGALHFGLSSDQMNSVVDAKGTFIIKGVLDIETPATVARLPLDSGATASATGSRFIYEGMTRTGEGPQLNIRMLTIDPDPPETREQFMRSEIAYTFALVNDARGEAIELAQGGGSGGSVMPPMPGVSFNSSSRSLRVDGLWPGEKNRVDAEWIRGSHLVIVGWQRRQRQSLALAVDSRIVKEIRP